ncbi:MAG: protein-disulfide reductase DsbD [Burkholderiaceae bacterium]
MALIGWASQFAHAADEYLQPEEAFKFSAKMTDAKTIEVTYVIADGYYMYRERFHFKADGAKLGEAVFPQGKVKFDETFKKNVETYRHVVTIKMPVEASVSFTFTSTGQGCADKGLCYPPMDSEIKLGATGRKGLLESIDSIQNDLNSSGSINMPAQSATNQSIAPIAKDMKTVAASAPVAGDSEMGKIDGALKSGKLLVILPLFLLLGLGLSFTPCVLPMVPILSFIIVGEGVQVSRSRGFALSATYALGMALIYTALGIAAGLIGEGLSAALQNTWVLATFAVLMVLLSLSMFDVYHLQIPASLQHKLTTASEKQKAGKLIGVFVMGAISALIIGPCVAAPLAGALVYISQTRDIVIGGSALFFMAVGMSVPLLLVGLSAGTLLPRAGAWMEGVKHFFGVLMLGMALWIVSPAIPVSAQMLGWAVLSIGYSVYLLSLQKGHWIAKAVGVFFAAIGLIELVGVSTGGRDVFAPLAHFSKNEARQIQFARVKSNAELDAAIDQAKGKVVMFDFYADWCVSCKEMEKLTFTDTHVQSQLANVVLLQVDVTANNAEDKALLKRFQLFGPPGIIFFDKQGREVQGARVIGYQNAEKFSQSLSFVM